MSSPSAEDCAAGAGEESSAERRGQQHEHPHQNPSGEEPSSSRQRSGDGEAWPEHVVESVAVRIASAAVREGGRLAVAPAVAALFQVGSTWRAVSYSELLWESLTRLTWLLGDDDYEQESPTWRQEFVRRHRTGRNLHTRNYVQTLIEIQDGADHIPVCRRLAIANGFLSAGFIDGSVQLFELPSGTRLATYGPDPGREVLGPFSGAISGLILNTRSSRLVFASQDGYIYVASTRAPGRGARNTRAGNLVQDGTLVDFTGSRSGRWWVGLFAGVPGRSLQIWDGGTEEPIPLGVSSLTDPDAVVGWRMLTERFCVAGRIRVVEETGGIALVVGCTSSRIQTIELEGDGIGDVLTQRESSRPLVVDSMDAWGERMVVVDARGVARVRGVRTLEETCRFRAVGRGGAGSAAGPGNVTGCMNWGYVVLFSMGRVRVWNAATGEYLYRIRERVGGDGDDASTVLAASDRYIAAWSAMGLQLWDFGAL